MRLVLLALALAVAAALPISAAEDSGSDAAAPILERISDYMNGLDTAQGLFRQINADGTESTGTIYLDRPWKARLEYDPPEPGLLVAEQRVIAIFDRKSNTGPEKYRIRGTPIYFLLADDFDLTDSEYLIRHIEGSETTEVHLRSLTKRFRGHVKVVFWNEPVELLGWTFIDEQENSTTFVLEGLERDVELSSRLFSIHRETMKQEKRNR